MIKYIIRDFFGTFWIREPGQGKARNKSFSAWANLAAYVICMTIGSARDQTLKICQKGITRGDCL